MQEPPPKRPPTAEELELECIRAVWEHLHEFSSARFGAYKEVYGPDPLDCLANYLWNIKVCEALLPTLNMVEVLLRNAVNQALSEKYGTFWFESVDWLDERDIKLVEKARVDADRLRDKRERAVCTADDIVIELGFRFWTNLLLPKYHTHVWNYVSYRSFPHLAEQPGANKRSRAHAVFAKSCTLRNRVCHGERVIHIQDLDGQLADAITALGWISEPTKRLAKKLSRYQHVKQGGLQECRDLIRSLAGQTKSPVVE